MAINSVLDMINSSIRLLNINAVGDTLTNEEAEEALDILNMMIDQWTNDPLNLFYDKTALYPMNIGQNVYTIGRSGTPDFVDDRPLKIVHMFTRIQYPNAPENTLPIDYPMEQITTEQYQNFPNKKITTQYPNYYLYQPTMPNGTITTFPITTISLFLGIQTWSQLSRFNTLNDSITGLPPGYLQAIRFNLAVNLAPQYGRVGNPSFALIEAKARETLAQLESTNTRPVYLGLDEMVTPRGRYSIYSDK